MGDEKQDVDEEAEQADEKVKDAHDEDHQQVPS